MKYRNELTQAVIAPGPRLVIVEKAKEMSVSLRLRATL